MSESSETMLDVRRVKKVFRSGYEDLVVSRDVSFTVAERCTAVITGESGCGKTTLLNLIGALDSCTTGRIIFRGFDITEEREENLIEFRSRELGFIFQFHYLLKDLTALENVLIPALIARVPRARASRRVRRVRLNRPRHLRDEMPPAFVLVAQRSELAIELALLLLCQEHKHHMLLLEMMVGVGELPRELDCALEELRRRTVSRFEFFGRQLEVV